MEVPSGSIVGFVGENGSGKTTTLRAILNLIKYDEGQIKVLGLDSIKDEKEIKEQVGVVLDDPFFYENTKLKEINTVMKHIYKNWDTNLYENYLKSFSLDINKAFKELSKGMKMKLKISIALSHRPKPLILDEPTSGLDPVSREDILDFFMDFIQDEENSIFLSSHITSDLDKIADYIIFIHNGNIILKENKDILFSDYGLVKSSEEDFRKINPEYVVNYRSNAFSYEVLVNNKQQVLADQTQLTIETITIETIMLLLIRGEK
ncbi:ABC transporter ATP-binding protein [endosymbiont 'TC1' of Trimyema compressum]|uniref:ABC transporter ATP-binding protein n=1 Tax=endosymbiont 'TC1' of Trimyema compressum TaxID=243899 RepID=UPI000AC120C0